MARDVVERICDWGKRHRLKGETYPSWWSEYFMNLRADAAASTMEASSAVSAVSTARVTDLDTVTDDQVRDYLLDLLKRRLSYIKGLTQDKVPHFDRTRILGSNWDRNADAIAYAYGTETIKAYAKGRHEQLQLGDVNEMAREMVGHILQWASNAQAVASESGNPEYTPPYVLWEKGGVARTNASGNDGDGLRTTVGSTFETIDGSTPVPSTATTTTSRRDMTIASILSTYPETLGS
jgi:hypothetical protein